MEKPPDARSSTKSPRSAPLLRRFQNAAAYVITGALVHLFWLFEGTMDVRAHGMENLRLSKKRGERPLLVLWHGKGFLPISYFHGERLCLYASHTRDPNYGGMEKAFRWFTLRMIERMGYQVMDASEFGSESRGVLHYVQTLRSGSGGAIAADGPGGPIYQAKPGACFLAKKTGVTLIPVGAAIRSGVRLDQWDHFEIPWMFSKGALVVGEAIRIPADADDALLDQKRRELEVALNHATRKAEERIGLHAHPTAGSDAQRASA